jgi:hypothetical protein
MTDMTPRPCIDASPVASVNHADPP